jgi:ubiquitin-conjugating enzyme E2 O
MQGCLVGTLDGEGRLTDSSREQPSSTGFRLALHNVLPRLVEALVDIGAKGCEQHRTSTSELTTH